MTIQEELRGEASAQRALAMTKHGIACADLLDRAARALDAAEKEDQVIEAAVADAFDSWGPHPSAQNIVDKIRAALAEIRGGK